MDSDRQLARQVKGIDIIVGGHSHTAVRDPVIESGTVIVQAGSNGIYLGVLNVTFDPKKKKILTYTRKDELRLVSPATGAEIDPEVARIVDKYESQVKNEFSRVIGTAAADLTRDSTRESNLGDIVADAMRDATGAQIAFQNGGGIRADIPKGPITLETVFTTVPFDNDLVSMDLTGEQIRELLERSVLSENMLQVSGIQIVYDLSKPAGAKVASVEVAGKPMAALATYRVVTNDFLASGGNQFNIFKKGRNISSGPSQRDAVADYIRKNSPMNVQARNRIVFKNSVGENSKPLDNDVNENIDVYVNGQKINLYRGMKVKHALMAYDQSLYKAALAGDIRIEDENGFTVGLEGSLADGARIFTVATA